MKNLKISYSVYYYLGAVLRAPDQSFYLDIDIRITHPIFNNNREWLIKKSFSLIKLSNKRQHGYYISKGNNTRD